MYTPYYEPLTPKDLPGGVVFTGGPYLYSGQRLPNFHNWIAENIPFNAWDVRIP